MIGFALSALNEGMLFSILALGVFISFRILHFPDLTVDGSYPLGAAVAAILIVKNVDPITATLIALLAGGIAGIFTGVLHTKLKIAPLLSGILSMICLYSINLRIMGRPNISLSPYLGYKTLITYLKKIPLPFSTHYTILLFFVAIVIISKVLIDLFFHTEIGLAIRATGDNELMIRSQGVNTDITKLIGLSLSNALVALSGALYAQYQGFSDIGMGIGMIVAGLASVITGQALIPGKKLWMMSLAVITGAVVYRAVLAAALKWGYNFGFKPTDLKLITGLLVVIILSFPVLRSKFKFKLRILQKKIG